MPLSKSIKKVNLILIVLVSICLILVVLINYNDPTELVERQNSNSLTVHEQTPTSNQSSNNNSDTAEEKVAEPDYNEEYFQEKVDHSPLEPQFSPIIEDISQKVIIDDFISAASLKASEAKIFRDIASQKLESEASINDEIMKLSMDSSSLKLLLRPENELSYEELEQRDELSLQLKDNMEEFDNIRTEFEDSLRNLLPREKLETLKRVESNIAKKQRDSRIKAYASYVDSLGLGLTEQQKSSIDNLKLRHTNIPIDIPVGSTINSSGSLSSVKPLMKLAQNFNTELLQLLTPEQVSILEEDSMRHTF